MKDVTLRKQQGGAVLVIGLVLLTVITVLAVSGMNTATTELAMARNHQSSENAFQAAEAGLAVALGQPNYPTAESTILTENLNANDSVSVGIDFERETIVTDRAFSLGVGSGGMAAFHFIARSEASSERAGIGNTTDRDATARHTQAFYIIGPQGDAL